MLDAEIESIHRMTPRVKQFQLRRQDGEAFDFRPGQHTQLHFESGGGDGQAGAVENGGDEEDDENEGDGESDGDDGNGEDDENGEEVVRPYTPTSLPGTGRVTLAIKRYDDGTASVYMHEREPGDTITIEEPDGNLYLRDLESDVVFVSTGTGITPPMAMLRHYLREGNGQAHFLYGERTQEDVMYRETLDGLEAEHDRLTVAYSLSREDWAGLTGHVQEHVEDVLDTLEGKDFYVCGVPEMVVETKERLDELGVPEEHVFSEGWEEDEVTEES